MVIVSDGGLPRGRARIAAEGLRYAGAVVPWDEFRAVRSVGGAGGAGAGLRGAAAGAGAAVGGAVGAGLAALSGFGMAGALAGAALGRWRERRRVVPVVLVGTFGEALAFVSRRDVPALRRAVAGPWLLGRWLGRQ